MKTTEIREKFLQFFAKHGHTIVSSSSLIPENDPTLLFTNSGIIQFKNILLSVKEPPYKRVTSVQRSIRAGGKHNDLEKVGYTSRHHTFFEMLGNFSFGDYFKYEAIHYAWTLLTQVFNLPSNKLLVTVYYEDEETYNIWANDIGLSKEQIIRIYDNKGVRYASDNFWQMADTGPCGPCSEIFYDHGKNIPGNLPGSQAKNNNGDRYIEIWNLVFMQFNRNNDGILVPLPRLCVDTGMGLERIAAVIQQVHSNYKIDLFHHLLQAIARKIGINDCNNTSLQVIADHIRASSFLIVDGILPNNEGRGYVLRRIVRRAMRHVYKLGQKKPFLYCLVDDLIKEMGNFYPELIYSVNKIKTVLKQEEDRFFETIERGITILESTITAHKKNNKQCKFDGNIAFKLHDTYGFPLDLTIDICSEHGLFVDKNTFNLAMSHQRKQSRIINQFKMNQIFEFHGEKTDFIGYKTIEVKNLIIKALYINNISVRQVEPRQNAIVVLNHTPFYAESGGQIGDRGIILTENNAKFIVSKTFKITPDIIGHYGYNSENTLFINNVVEAKVNSNERICISRNHSATHLLHKALRDVLGKNVTQKGSLVNSEKIRFDFNYHAPLSLLELSKIESLVNAQILDNSLTEICMLPFDTAVKNGAIAIFNERYNKNKEVRVVNLGQSSELCIGTHVSRSGDIGLFKIITENSIASGIRRIEAITGETSVHYVQEIHNQFIQCSELLKSQSTNFISKIRQLQQKLCTCEATITQLQNEITLRYIENLSIKAININGLKVVTSIINNIDNKCLKFIIDQLKSKLDRAVVMLAKINNDKTVNLFCGVTSPDNQFIKANNLINLVVHHINGKGGGRADIAQAGGSNCHGINNVLKETLNIITLKQQKI